MKKNRFGLILLIIGVIVVLLPDIFILSGDFAAVGKISNKLALYRIIAIVLLSIPLFLKVSWLKYIFGVYSLLLLFVAISTVTDTSVVYAKVFKTRWIIFAIVEFFAAYIFIADRKVRGFLKE